MISRDRYTCIYVYDSHVPFAPYSTIDNKEVHLVSYCPQTWNETVFKHLCEQASSTGTYVYDNDGVNFINIYCAICHGRQISNIYHWHVPTSSVETCQVSDHSWTVDGSHKSDRGMIYGKRLRYCPDMVDHCPNAYDNTTMARICEAIYAPTCWENIYYKNVHCVSCLDAYQRPDQCDKQVDQSSTFHNMWQFQLRVIGDNECPAGEILDIISGKCRLQRCGKGFTLVGNRCITVVDPSDGKLPVVQCLQDNLRVNLRGTRFVGKCFTDKLMEIFEVDYKSFLDTVIWDDYQIRASKRPVDNHVSLIATNTSGVILVELIKRMLSEHGNLLAMECNLTAANVLFICDNSTDESRGCAGQWYSGRLSEFALKSGTDVGTLYQWNGVFIKSYLSTYVLEHAFTSPPVLKEAFALCGDTVPNLQCSHVLLKITEVNLDHGNGTTTLHYGNVTFKQEEFSLMPDGHLRICVDEKLIGQSELNLPVILPQWWNALDVAYVIGSCFTLCSLPPTFLTYCVFKKLRNLHGRSLMNLLVALFIAHALLLFSKGSFVLSNLTCVIVAVVSHYVWLAAFTWMTVVAIVQSYTFVINSKQLIEDTIANRLLPPILGWGIPFAIVSITIALHVCKCTHVQFEYGGTDSCWIVDPTANFIVFGVPVAVLQLVNYLSFVAMIVVLNTERLKSNHLQHKNKHAGEWNHFVLSLKVRPEYGSYSLSL